MTNLSTYLTSDGAMTGVELANAIGVSPAFLYHIAKGRRTFPVQLVKAAIAATGGALTESGLRPDDWRLIWPELNTNANPMTTVKDIGGPAAVARMTGLSVPTVHGWKLIPYQHCPAIELGTHGKHTCESMRPDVSWVRVKDPSWPNKKGRPLIDFGSAAKRNAEA